MLKNEKKIRELLGKKYHFSCDNEGRWVLYRMYDDPKIYFSNDNTAVMTNEDATEEELIDYLKKHREWNLEDVIFVFMSAISFVCFILAMINVYYHSIVIRTLILTLCPLSCITITIKSIVHMHNSTVFFRDMEDFFKETQRDVERLAKEAENERNKR